jgi:hypothetical protein
MNAAGPKARLSAVKFHHGREAARTRPYLAATAVTIGALALSALALQRLGVSRALVLGHSSGSVMSAINEVARNAVGV